MIHKYKHSSYFLIAMLFLLAGCAKTELNEAVIDTVEDELEVIGELTHESELVDDWEVVLYTRDGAKFNSNDTYRFKSDNTGIFSNACRWSLESSDLLIIETYDNAGRPKEVKWDVDGFSGDMFALSNIRTHCTLNPTDVKIELILQRK